MGYVFYSLILSIKKIKNKERRNEMKEIYNMWDWLVDKGIATDEEVRLVTNINGFSVETLNNVLYARTRYHDREQYEDGGEW
jgi:hypothetical protein